MRRRCAASFGEVFFSGLVRVDLASSDSSTFRNAKVELTFTERSDFGTIYRP